MLDHIIRGATEMIDVRWRDARNSSKPFDDETREIVNWDPAGRVSGREESERVLCARPQARRTNVANS